MKYKGLAVLVLEPQQKRGCDHDEPEKNNRTFCVYHNVRTHNTEDYQ